MNIPKFNKRLFTFLFVALAAGAVPQTAAQERAVLVNGERVDDALLRAVEALTQTPVPDGHYFYDALSGAWGYAGGPVVGFTVAGLPLPGPMPADISASGTGTFINGRELHPQDVAALRHLLGEVHAGRFWMDAFGNFGQEGAGLMGNVVAIAQQRGALRSAGGSAYASDGSWVTTDGNGGVAISFREFGGGTTSYSN